MVIQVVQFLIAIVMGVIILALIVLVLWVCLNRLKWELRGEEKPFWRWLLPWLFGK